MILHGRAHIFLHSWHDIFQNDAQARSSTDKEDLNP